MPNTTRPCETAGGISMRLSPGIRWTTWNGGLRPETTKRDRAGDAPNIGQLASGIALRLDRPCLRRSHGAAEERAAFRVTDRDEAHDDPHRGDTEREQAGEHGKNSGSGPPRHIVDSSRAQAWCDGSARDGWVTLPPVASETVGAHADLSPSRAWWLRVPATLLSPRSVFFALREEDEDDVAARGEPLLLVTLLAGMAAVLATPTAADLLDNPEYDALLLAIWTSSPAVSTARSATS